PYKNNVPMNYIKRLIGLPGETIAIHAGNVYVLSAERGLKYNDYEKALSNPELMATLWRKDHMHVDSSEALARWQDKQFHIIRKDPETLLAMMRLVFDNNHPGKGQPERWQGAAGWKAEARGFQNDGSSSALGWLRYRHLADRERPTQPELITDFMGYNS